MPRRPHKLICEAPICHDNHEMNYVWYPGEPVCKKGTYKYFQRIQNKISKITKKRPELKNAMFRTRDLLRMRRVDTRVLGKNLNTIYRYLNESPDAFSRG